MRNDLFKKGLVFGIIVLFLGMSITTSARYTAVKDSNILSNSDNTLYVGGSGPGNYSKIKDAYNDANPGDTIFVYSGTYYEYIWIRKTINLIGEDPDTTSIIYNSKTTAPFRMEAPYIVISGFTIYNPNHNLVRYISLRNEGHHCLISNCIFYNSHLHFDDGTCGISIVNSSYNTLSNCTFLCNDDEGICLNVGSSHNNVENCTFSNCGDGIEFQNSSYNMINNCIMKDGIHCGIAITVKDLTSNNNIIKNCQINNLDQGGIFLCNAYNNMIYNCSFENNKFYGIHITGEDSYNNLIVNNKISNPIGTFNDGISLQISCHDNTISNNHIINCNICVEIENNNNQFPCNDNLFYHNNFIDNTKGAYDECNNIWDKGYPIGGNYWSDYTGVDNDGDGIGDTPYNISGGDNKDYYPLMEPWIKEEITVGANGPYYGLINEPIKFHGVAVGGYKPYSWFWDFGDTYTSDEQNPTHIYTEAGKYDIVLTVTDSHGNSSNDTTFARIQNSNIPPVEPSIDGPSIGQAGISYPYTFTATDPEGLHIWYCIDWGDETETKWIGPYDSGTGITEGHTWANQGTYIIRCKAKDPYDDEGPWGELLVTMPRYRASTNSLLLWFLERFPLLERLLSLLL